MARARRTKEKKIVTVDESTSTKTNKKSINSRRPTTVERILSIVIKPGWRGLRSHSHRRAMSSGVWYLQIWDLVFIFVKKLHNLFKRGSNDIIMSMKVSVFEVEGM
ncbi:hypothetical protein MKX03_001519 [Papaver bracteatum]|nr:hypothetical protein MKX03_001519 [Papaver bracteatum]